MRLTFLGHAAFLIETHGQRLITDPYSSEIGYNPIALPADIVTLSHENPKWHSCLEAVKGQFEVVRGLEILEAQKQLGPLKIGAALTYENLPDDGPNAMVWIESEGLRVLHTGDCGIMPDDATIAKCGRVDVLLALAGGPPTISLDDLMLLIAKLQPKIVIPMHYGVSGLQMNALPVEELEKRWNEEQIVRHEGSFIDISSENLPEKMELHILPPARIQNSTP